MASLLLFIVRGMVPCGSGWAEGEHYIWAERSHEKISKWVYLHTYIKSDIGRAGWSSETGICPARFPTRAAALAYGIAHIELYYHGHRS